MDGHMTGGMYLRRISDHCAEVRCHDWEADGVIEVGEDEETGDLLVRPAAYSGRSGAPACRWTLRGIADGLDLVAPLWQGMKVAVDDAVNRNARRRRRANGRPAWPSSRAGRTASRSTAGTSVTSTRR